MNQFSQNKQLTEIIDSKQDCESVAMNMIVSEITGFGPIALTPKFSDLEVSPKTTRSLQRGGLYRSYNNSTRTTVISQCLNEFSELFHKNYLVKSRFRNCLRYFL